MERVALLVVAATRYEQGFVHHLLHGPQQSGVGQEQLNAGPSPVVVEE